MSESAQPEAKRQRIEQQDDHPNPPTDATTEDAKKMAQETSKMEAEATAEGEFWGEVNGPQCGSDTQSMHVSFFGG